MEHPKDLQTDSTTHTAIQAQNATVSELIPPDLLTIILTTSPIPSAPSPELVQNTLASLPPCFKGVPIVLTFDGYKISKTEKGQLKRGKVPEEIVATYPEYIENVKNLFSGRNEDSEIEEEGHFRSHATGVTFLRLKKRMGFAFSVKAGLDYVKTPYVMILQHDWLFTLPYPPISTLLSILQDEAEDVKYIGFVARMSKDYIKQKNHQHNFKMVFQMSAELRKDRPLGNEMISCFHWFDRPHFTSIEIYKKIFDLGILRRGDFIEDTFGTKYLTSISSAKTDEEAFEEWKKFGAWMYYPFNGKEVSVRHGSGRTNLLGEREEERVQQLIKGCQEKTTRDWKTEKVRAEGEGCYEEFLGDLHGEEPQECVNCEMKRESML